VWIEPVMAQLMITFRLAMAFPWFRARLD
jgi:hypothetical protein